MAFQLSPGVEIKEFDLTNVIPAIATTPAGYVGMFQWGPQDQRVLITSEKQLQSVFGTPTTDSTMAISWFVASNFLSYGGALQVVRASHASDLNATDNGSGALVQNRDKYESFNGTYTFKFAAKYPGTLGNGLKVVVIDGDVTTNTDTEWTTFTDAYGIPGTSSFASTLGATNDELHVLVIDATGKWSGTPGTVLETFLGVSKAKNAKNADGTTNYWKNVVNNKSQYVWVGTSETGSALFTGSQAWDTDATTTSSFKQLINLQDYILSGGSLNNPSDATISAAFQEQFTNAEEVDVSLLIAGNISAAEAKKVVEIAANRQDCIAFVSPSATTIGSYGSSSATIFSSIKDYKTTVGNSSYGVMDGNAKYQYDRFNDRFLYVPLCGDIAGCCVRTDNTKEPWYSPAGYDRGRINNIVKLAWNPSKEYRDDLYNLSINPVVTFQGTGAILFGDKTLQTKASAFDRINVRRLFNVLEKTIATAAKFQLFEFNDAFTRAQFRQLVDPFLREVQGKRGVSSYAVVCDESNNPPSVIDQNQFVADIFIAPARSINFIRLNFVATPTGVTFAEFGG
jgi:phage tail sheath protein FI